jgi:CDP-L-myo-inositol myo-inositolphosphotransferase
MPPMMGVPRVGVVLAAGRSERLRAVTGGGSKALVRLGGLRLVERAIRTLLGTGVERVIVVVGYHAGPVAAVAQRTAPGRVQVVEAAGWEEGNGASLAAAEQALAGDPTFLVVTVDNVFAEEALAEVASAGRPVLLVDPAPDPDVWKEATKVSVDPSGRVLELGKDTASPTVDAGALLLPREVFESVRRSRARGDGSLAAAVTELAAGIPVTAVPIRSEAWWQDVDTPEDLARAARQLRSGLPRPSDGPVARLLNRRLSVPVSWFLVRFGPNPDLLSAAAFVVGLVAAAFLASGLGVAGGILVQLCSILDGVDGEVARLQIRAGPRGTLLDGVLDRLGDAAICAALGVWAADAGTSSAVTVILVAAATAGSMLSMATKDRVAALGLEPPSERRLGWLLGGRDGRLFIIAVLSVFGLPIAALAASAATSLLAAAIRVSFARTVRPS